MRDKPVGLVETDLLTALAEGWAVEGRTVKYLPLGAGSYHWSVVDHRGTAWFVKVDDLGAGQAGRDDAFAQLFRSFGAASALRRDAGLDFVLAPILVRRRRSPRRSVRRPGEAAGWRG